MVAEVSGIVQGALPVEREVVVVLYPTLAHAEGRLLIDFLRDSLVVLPGVVTVVRVKDFPLDGKDRIGMRGSLGYARVVCANRYVCRERQSLGDEVKVLLEFEVGVELIRYSLLVGTVTQKLDDIVVVCAFGRSNSVAPQVGVVGIGNLIQNPVGVVCRLHHRR